jgi:hypothetical protein
VRASVEPHDECLNRPGDVPQMNQAKRLESQVESAAHMT